MACGAEDQVVARAAIDIVVFQAVAGVGDAISRLAVDGGRAGASHNGVVAIAAHQRVSASTALDKSGAASAMDVVRAIARHDGISTHPAVHVVGAITQLNVTGTVAEIDIVVAVTGVDRVTAWTERDTGTDLLHTVVRLRIGIGVAIGGCGYPIRPRFLIVRSAGSDIPIGGRSAREFQSPFKGVVARAQHDHVAPNPGDHQVVAQAADDCVIAVLHGDQVSLLARRLSTRGLADGGGQIGLGAGEDLAIAIRQHDQVGATIACNDVIARLAIDGVLAVGAARERAMTTAQRDHVGRAG